MFEEFTMKATKIFFILSILISLPLGGSAVEFGKPDGVLNILPDLSMFGDKATAFSFEQSRDPEEAEQMAKTGIFDSEREFAGHLAYVIREDGMRSFFNLLRIPSAEKAKELFEMKNESYRKRDSRGIGSISKVEDKKNFSCFIIEYTGGQIPRWELWGVVKNLHFSYMLEGGNESKKEVEEFSLRYVAFLMEQLEKGAAPLIPERIWTSNTGKELKGSILGFNAEKRVIKFGRFDGKVYPAMSLDLLSEEDQKLIVEELSSSN